MTFASIARLVLDAVLAAAFSFLTSWLREKKLERLGYDRAVIDQLRENEKARKRYEKSFANRPRTLDDLARRLRADAAAQDRSSLSDPGAGVPSGV